MKFNKILISAGIAALSMGLGSCVGDLDLTPTDPTSQTPDKFAENPMQYMQQVIADVYFQYASYGVNGNNTLVSMDGGMSTFQRAIFILEEIPTDMASWQSDDVIGTNWQYGNPATNNVVVMGTYSRMMANIAICNQFIQTDFGCKTPEEVAMYEEFCRQARILRDATYFYLIDAFGNVPWADESVGMGSIAPQLSTDFAEGRRLVFERVTEDLESIVSWYKTNDPNNRPPYGYVGLDMAESILAKFYLNAEVYTGMAQWQKCFDHSEAVIARMGKGGYKNSGLCNSYFQNFSYNNNDYAIGGAGNVHEIIWTIPQDNPASTSDGKGLMSFANGTFMLNAWIGNSTGDDTFTCTMAEFNSGNGWKCMSMRQQGVEIFDWNANYTASPDKRVSWWKTAKDGFTIENPQLISSMWGYNGFLPVKFTNWYIDDNGNVDEALSPAATDQLGIDCPMLRLAEVYLMSAEAALNLSNSAKALEYINLTRGRAGLEPINTANIGALQTERARELYTECTRRTDLIRWNKWISGYSWNWKAGLPAGGDFAPNFIVYPLPATVISTNGYTQNPGY